MTEFFGLRFLLFCLTLLLSAVQKIAPANIKNDIYTNTWVVEVQGGPEAAKRLATDLFLHYHGPVGSMENLHIVEHRTLSKKSKSASALHHKLLTSHKKISYAMQEKVLSRKKRDGGGFGPDFYDPLYVDQWYLKNTGQTALTCAERHDINVEAVWDKGITGAGVVVSILDDGLEYTHPDLVKNYDKCSSYDFNRKPHTADPMPRYTPDSINKHGTRCAGEVSAERGNDVCGTGVAYDAKVSGIRMLDGDVTDGIEAGSLSYRRDLIDIYSSSWGPDDDGITVDGPGPLAKTALKDGVEKGRNGLGSIFVWATGNGGGVFDYCSCDGYINSPYTISIGAVDNCGGKPWYSEMCPGTFAVTYSSGDEHDLQVVTTDLNKNCTKKHTGTSAAAPIAAGIFALVLQANSQLTWRDLQHLIAHASKKISPDDIDWQQNGAGHYVNVKFGFGALDADALVVAATQSDWETAAPQKNHTTEKVSSNLTEATDNTITSIIEYKCNAENNESCITKLEHVHAVITLRLARYLSPYGPSALHGKRGQHKITLTSPSGTESDILRERPRDSHARGDAFLDWEFLTLFHWDENPIGEWILTVTDFSKSHSARSHWENKEELSWELKLTGT